MQPVKILDMDHQVGQNGKPAHAPTGCMLAAYELLKFAHFHNSMFGCPSQHNLHGFSYDFPGIRDKTIKSDIFTITKA